MISPAWCILVHGDRGYAAAGREAVFSALRHTPFPVHLFHAQGTMNDLPPHGRLVRHGLRAPPPDAHPSFRFLMKFEALEHLLETTDHDPLLLLDADAAVVRSLSTEDVAAALGEAEWAMAEQTGIRGSSMRRPEFLAHYAAVSLACLEPDARPPSLQSFRYYNTGVVIGRRRGWRALTTWSRRRLASLPTPEQNGQWVADQDFIQYWVHQRQPDRTVRLDPAWNHCPLWDEDFPAPDARIIHLSNFLRGPGADTASWLRAFRQHGPPAGWPPSGPDAPAVPPWTGCLLIVVTHNSATVLRRCLEALLACPGSAVAVIDNHSTDNSVAIALDAGASVIRWERNAGFAAAVNRVVSDTSSRWLGWINPDCLLTPEIYQQAMEVLKDDPRACCSPDLDQGDHVVAGVQGGYTRRKILVDLLESNQRWGWLCRRLRSTPGFHHPRRKWVLGTCLFVGRETFLSAGGLDERYPLYMEDVEFGETLSRRGHALVRLPSRVRHLSCQGSAVAPAYRQRMLNDARLRYAERQYGRWFVRWCRWLVGLAGGRL